MYSFIRIFGELMLTVTYSVLKHFNFSTCLLITITAYFEKKYTSSIPVMCVHVYIYIYSVCVCGYIYR